MAQHTLGGKENDPAAKINIFIDGTRLLVQCAAGGSMAQLRNVPRAFSDTAGVRTPLDGMWPMKGGGVMPVSNRVFDSPSSFLHIHFAG